MTTWYRQKPRHHPSWLSTAIERTGKRSKIHSRRSRIARGRAAR